MFLNRLSDKEKSVFLELTHYVARNSADFGKDEKEIISKYCKEMEIENIVFENNNFNLKDKLSQITNKKSQKIIFIEIMTLVYSDGLLDENENNILEIIIEEYKIDRSVALISSEWAKAVLALYVQGEMLTDL